MKLIYVLLIQVVFFANVFGQNMITSYSETEHLIHRSDFEYDPQGRLIEKVQSSQHKGQGVFVLKSKTEWLYENDKLKSIKKYQFNDDDWFLKVEYRIIYNDAGCIDRQEQTFYINSDESREHIITMVNEYDCADSWKNKQDHLFLADSPHETIITRRRTDTSEIEIYDEYNENIGTWVIKGAFERKYNQKNNITELINSTLSYSYARKFVSIYDNTDENIMSQLTFYKNEPDSEWELTVTEDYTYEGSQVKKINSITPSGRAFEDFFEYYCDGLLKRIIITGPDEYTNIKTYEYDQKINCPEECEQLENLDVILYPNPAKDWIYIQSDIFQKESSEILVFDVLGKLIHSQKVLDRVPKVRIRLNQSSNVNQMFIIHLISEGGYSINKKFMIE